MKKVFIWFVAIVALQGCVEFNRQTMVYKHDVVRDELRMLMIYEGIYGRKTEDYAELRSVLLRPRTFFFANWILEFDRDEWVRELERLDRDEDAQSQRHREAYRRFLELSLDNVRVDNGSFYLNNEGKLSAYQRVTFSKISELVSAFNEVVNTYLIQDESAASEMPLASSQSADEIIQAALDGHGWIALDNGVLRIRLPLAEEDYEQFCTDRANDSSSWKAIEAGISEVYHGGVLEFAFGHEPQLPNSISMVVSDDEYTPNLLPFVEADGLLETVPDFDAIVRQFVSRETGW